MMRDLVGRLGGQMRWIAGDDRVVFAGWDMTAALALAGALGLPAHLVAEMLPAIEAAAVEAAASDGDPAGGDDDV
ncbi:MAG TPA: hypothetical protein PKD10_17205 [Paracoccaceae bacterium]|nr:hypothetical protein [Paracoccaceae bacterium]